MAPSIHHSDHTFFGTNGTSHTRSITPPSGASNGVLIVCSVFHADPGTVSMTWNGVSLTEHGSKTPQGGTTNDYMSTFRLINPTMDGSAHDCVISCTNSARPAVSYLFLKDTDQTTPFDAMDEDNTDANRTNIQNTVTSEAGDLVIGFTAPHDGVDPTYVHNTAGQTNIGGAYDGAISAGINSAYLPGGASVVFDISWTGSKRTHNRCINANAAAAAGPPKFLPEMLGTISGLGRLGALEQL